MTDKPEILAPAGDEKCFLAAVAAGADAVYLGLKHFSARMEAENFSVSRLGALRRLATDHGVRVYVAFNVMVKPDDGDSVFRLCEKLVAGVGPDALIVADPGVLVIARQAGFSGELHLSTLANVSHPAGIEWAGRHTDVSRVILPRELSVDEIRACARACPPHVSTEVFVHGALCYGVSGRCYWSSFLGGKSGLRGRCVQPCRRVYEQQGQGRRVFSCSDLGLADNVWELLQIDKVAAWKIEGRKKGPHYVHHTVSAYRLLRDNPGDGKAKDEARRLLRHALGRPHTPYFFVPYKKESPVSASGQTGSGLHVGRVNREPSGRLYFDPKEDLCAGDLLRVGYEDQPGHQVVPVQETTGDARFFFSAPKGPKRLGPNTPVFLIDRRRPQVFNRIRELAAQLAEEKAEPPRATETRLTWPTPAGRSKGIAHVHVYRTVPRRKPTADLGLWLDARTHPWTQRTRPDTVWWWLPPVIWPEEEEAFARAVDALCRKGAGKWVLNAPWQAALFEGRKKRLSLWAGPFCNLANPFFTEFLKDRGFAGAIASPELAGEDYENLAAKSALPLGVVEQGAWPVAVSRIIPPKIRHEAPMQSPRQEPFWLRVHGSNTWVYPGWRLSIKEHRRRLVAAGYSLFVQLFEPWPKAVPQPEKTTPINFDKALL